MHFGCVSSHRTLRSLQLRHPVLDLRCAVILRAGPGRCAAATVVDAATAVPAGAGAAGSCAAEVSIVPAGETTG